jgi:hypothetical protein
MFAVEIPAMSDRPSLRRSHSPVPINAAASSAPSPMRTPGPIHPCSIE